MPPPYPPPRLRLAQLFAVAPRYLASRPLQNRSKNSSYFWIEFWSIFGPILVPFWLHFCSIFGLGSLLDTHLYQKRGFSRNLLKTNEKSRFVTPRRSGNRANFDPRRLQEVIISLLNLHLAFWSIFAPSGLPKCIKKNGLKNMIYFWSVFDRS